MMSVFKLKQSWLNSHFIGFESSAISWRLSFILLLFQCFDTFRYLLWLYPSVDSIFNIRWIWRNIFLQAPKVIVLSLAQHLCLSGSTFWANLICGWSFNLFLYWNRIWSYIFHTGHICVRPLITVCLFFCLHEHTV